MARLTDLMRANLLCLDPDLTLAKLSGRLRIPAKQLSSAINRSTAENVSRFVENARIRAAQEMLRDGQSMT